MGFFIKKPVFLAPEPPPPKAVGWVFLREEFG
jgi:hypothetical protein